MKIILKNYIKYIIVLIIFFIFINTFNITNWYLKKITPKINEVVEKKLEKVTYEIITDKINTDLINENNLRDVLVITKNKDGEILTVDYNLEKAYSVNNMINESIRNSITNLELGTLKNSEFFLGEDSMYINPPLFISSDYPIISALGPKIPIKVSFIGTVVTNLKTKITSYGLNNVLNEIYVNVEITETLTTPVTHENVKLVYDILIDATMINGRVPSYYGNELIKETPIVSENIEN